MLMIIKWWHD